MTDDELSQLKQKYEAARAEAWVVVEAYLNHCNGGTDLRALRSAVAKTDAARAAYVEAEAAHKAEVSAPATLATEKATPPACVSLPRGAPSGVSGGRALRQTITRLELLVACATMLVAPVVVQAQFGNSDNGNGTCAITGYTGTSGTMTIPSKICALRVTSIGDGAFEFCTRLTDVTIPDSVTNVGDRAFDACTSLTGLTIGNSVTSIGEDAFKGCTSLTSVTIPKSVVSIGKEAFRRCTNLTGVHFNGNAPSLGWDVFTDDTHVTIH